MNYDNILIKIFLLDDWHFNKKNVSKYKTSRRLKNKLHNIVDYIEHRYDDSLSFRETIYRMNFKIEERPVCKKCGNSVDFVGKNGKIFKQYCSLSCSNSSSESLKKKQESDKAKHNGKLGWNRVTPEKIQHRKESLIQKYGDWNTACKIIETKRQEGVFRKYGTNNIMCVPEIQQNRNNTLKQLRTVVKSKMEDDAYSILLNYFTKENIQRQYSSEQYPWLCDFHITPIDLYIECHFSQFHNGRPYIGDECDQLELETFKTRSEILKLKYHKSKTQYDNIIYTWTNLDVRKLQTFQSQQLNYIIAYSLDDLISQLQQYKK